MARIVAGLLLFALSAPVAARRTPAPPPPAAVPAAPTIRSGVDKWRAGDYPAAVAIWTPFAAAGDADAMFNVGQAYKLGRGVTADAATARDYYRRAAGKGHLPAQANLGIALFQAGDKPEAIKWLTTAADRGEARAQYVLGIATFNGDGVPRSQSVGYAYLLRAQASGLPQAVTALGTIAPGLSPADRTAGEAVAASLAAGTGVPRALTASTSRSLDAIPPARIAIAPVVSRVTVSAPATGPSVAPLGVPPRPVATSPAPSTASAIRAPTAATGLPASAIATHVVAPSFPPVVRPSIPVPVAAAIPVPADAAAASPRPDRQPVPVTTAAVPASRLPDPLATAPPVTDVPAARPVVVPPPVRAARPEPSPLKPFQTVAAPARKADGWRVQLGAFSSRKLADAAWSDVKDLAAAKPIFAGDGPVTKLQIGPFATRDAAKVACAKLSAAGRACFVTAD